MIVEQPVINFLALETSEDGDTWDERTGALLNIEINRGGTRAGATSTVEVGTLVATLKDAGDPLTDDALKPNLLVRLRHRVSSAVAFTGRVVDIAVSFRLDKATGERSTIVTFIAADAVREHSATKVYGAVSAGGVGYEKWAARIERLAASATTEIDLPADDAPIVRYEF